MSLEAERDVRLEIGHVLFIDIVGYSKLLTDEQRERLAELNQIVRATEAFRIADAAGKLIRLPTGDGMVLVFFTSPDAPARCAIAISHVLKGNHSIPLRMGIHSGPVEHLAHVDDRPNLAGAGVNMAQRVMSCGDSGHILFSARSANDLGEVGEWKAKLHSLGQIEVKHGVQLELFNLYDSEIGNAAVPQSLVRARRRRLAWTGLIALSILAAAALWFARSSTPAPNENGIAVLPFENLSADKENAFLASGLQDEILTQLAKIGSLKVISRTSTAQYEAHPKSLRKIAAELGVASILEGSVQKIDKSIRVNVQLIKATTDAHLWAESYNRELIDMLKVQSEVAQQIATTLSATLTREEKMRIDQRSTTNPEAYALYLKGTELLRAPSLHSTLEEGQHDFEQAIALDANFALAHARLAQIHTRIALFYDPSPIHKERGRTEGEEALRLQPQLSEGHVALGLYYGRLAREYDRALEEYELAKQGAPNDVQIIYGIAHVQMRHGQFRAAIANWECTVSLDPMNWNMYDNLANAYSAVGMYAAAERAARREVELVPEHSPGRFELEEHWAWNYVDLTGSFEKLDEVLARYASAEDPSGNIASTRFDVRMAERNSADAENAIASSTVTIFESFAGPRATKNFYLAQVAAAQGDMAKARPFFEKELEFARKELNEAPDSEVRHAQVGLICAYVGRKEEAIAEGKRAMELMPISKDAVDGPYFEINLAQIYAIVGEPDQAIDLLERSLRTPAGVTIAVLKTWSWDGLRNHPRFQKLINGPPPKIVYD
jgi:TolB-like protein/class 3 adenylate cyclase